MPYLLFAETSGNQAYLYATNRLKENIGASELTYRTGTRWMLEEVARAGGPSGLWEGGRVNREALALDPRRSGIEVILATSGKALVLVEKRDQAQTILRNLTERALREAPGLDLCGAIVELRDDSNESFAQAYNEVHHRYNHSRNLMPSPLERHHMLPGLQACGSSGQPAEKSHEVRKGKHEAFSSSTARKRGAAPDWFKRMGLLMDEHNKKQKSSVQLSASVDELERKFENLDWVGVIFADGNGLGQVFMNFKKYLNGKPYAKTLREFSIAIDRCTEAAFHAACRATGNDLVPVVPLVLGGDDLTLVMDGRLALNFAQVYLREFERETAKEPIIREIAEAALGAPRLSACAGVAIVKPHFPFHAAHAMAEELLAAAKKVKQHVTCQRPGLTREPFPCSALDFHVLYDSTFHSLDLLRETRRSFTEEGKHYRLYGGPYVITPAESLKAPDDAQLNGADWAQEHTLQALLDRVQHLQAKDEEGRYCLPNSQVHALREALTQGPAVADSVLTHLCQQYGAGAQALCESTSQASGLRSVFRQDPKAENDHYSTRFLDALSSSEFWTAVTPSASAAHTE